MPSFSSVAQRRRYPPPRVASSCFSSRSLPPAWVLAAGFLTAFFFASVDFALVFMPYLPDGGFALPDPAANAATGRVELLVVQFLTVRRLRRGLRLLRCCRFRLHASPPDQQRRAATGTSTYRHAP